MPPTNNTVADEQRGGRRSDERRVPSIKRGDSEEAKKFWAFAERVAERVSKWPEWMKDRGQIGCVK